MIPSRAAISRACRVSRTSSFRMRWSRISSRSRAGTGVTAAPRQAIDQLEANARAAPRISGSAVEYVILGTANGHGTPGATIGFAGSGTADKDTFAVVIAISNARDELDYELDPQLIATRPVEPRDAARLRC